MPVHPAIEPLLANIEPVAGTTKESPTVEESRAHYRDLAKKWWPQPLAMRDVTDAILPTSPPLKVRRYVPDNDAEIGILLFFHGGSFVRGDLESHDGICRRLASDTRMRVLAVEYRLAPEFPFPAAVNDAIAAVRYVTAHVDEFGAPDAAVIVAGDSAGATLATVAAAATRRDPRRIVGQALIYPTMGPELLTSSSHKYARGYLLEIDQLRRDYANYLGDGGSTTDPRLAPLMNLDLRDLPPSVVVVAECDPLRDEGVAYVGLLEHFGNRVELLEAEGMVHGFLRIGGMIPEALSVIDDVARHLNDLVRTARP